MLVHVPRVDVAVRIGSIVASVDRGPQRTVRCDGQPGAVADARSERLGPTAAWWYPDDRRPRRIGFAVVGGDVARRADREVDRAVGPDDDTLQRVRIRAVQLGAFLVG